MIDEEDSPRTPLNPAMVVTTVLFGLLVAPMYLYGPFDLSRDNPIDAPDGRIAHAEATMHWLTLVSVGAVVAVVVALVVVAVRVALFKAVPPASRDSD